MDNQIIDRIKKLQALARSSTSANEAAIAAGVANRLIDQYRFSEEDLESDSFVEDEGSVYETGKVTEWKKMLVGVLARHYGCAHWLKYTYPDGRKVTHFKLVGKTSDIQIVNYMFNWLVLECSRLADKEVKGCGRVFIASYCTGFVVGVEEQLKQSRVEVQKEVSASALIKIDSRIKEARKVMYELHSNLRSIKTCSSAQLNSTAFSEGKSRGSSINLGRSNKLLGN